MALGFTAPVFPSAEPVVAPAAVTGVTVETALFSAVLYSSIPAGFLRSPQTFSLYISGLVTSSAAAQTVILTPRVGTSTAGAALGASTALALGSTITNAFWDTWFNFTTRAVGSGTAAAIYGIGDARVGQTAGPTATLVTGLYGGTVANFDSTIAQGLFMGVTPSAAGVSIQATQVRLVAWD